MDGVQIVQDLLEAADFSSFTPEPEITSGVLWDAVSLPAITVSQVSGIPRNIVKAGATRRVTDRIQVTALARNYPEVKDLLASVRAALADTIGEVDGVEGVTVHWDSRGPDFMNEEASIYMQSDDYFVGYTQAT